MDNNNSKSNDSTNSDNNIIKCNGTTSVELASFYTFPMLPKMTTISSSSAPSSIEVSTNNETNTKTRYTTTVASFSSHSIPIRRRNSINNNNNNNDNSNSQNNTCTKQQIYNYTKTYTTVIKTPTNSTAKLPSYINTQTVSIDYNYNSKINIGPIIK